MSLEGNLTAFGLSEILQLIAVQQKSGMLNVSSDDRHRVLFFRDGRIISTRDRRRKTKDPLKDYMTRYGILLRDDLIRLTQISAQSKLDLTDIIVSEGFLTEEAMRTHYRNHIQEAVHEILTWEQCSYKFIPGLDIIDGIKSWGEFNIEGMLMESMRRIDEFPAMLKEFPDLTMRIAKKAAPKEGEQLSSNETTVFAMLTEERTLSYLIAHATVPQFETYEALKHLSEKGLISVAMDPAVQEQIEKAKQSESRTREARARNIIPFMASLVLFAAAMFWGAKTTLPHIAGIAMQPASATGVNVERNRVEAKIRWKLEAYRAVYSNYPPELLYLVKSGLVGPSFLDGIKRYEFRYHLTSDSEHYTLL
jgi:hypothetical protein